MNTHLNYHTEILSYILYLVIVKCPISILNSNSHIQYCMSSVVYVVVVDCMAGSIPCMII